jgi:hypothetical protein
LAGEGFGTVNNHYYTDLDCVGCNSFGVGIDGTDFPNYFFDSTTSPLFDTWDFVTVWQQSPGDYPTLR